MDNEAKVAGFLAITELYLKMTDKHADEVTEDEIKLLISNVNNSNLSSLFYNQKL